MRRESILGDLWKVNKGNGCLRGKRGYIPIVPGPSSDATENIHGHLEKKNILFIYWETSNQRYFDMNRTLPYLIVV